MDKEPTQGEIWTFALAASIVGYLAGRCRAWLAAILLPVALALPLTLLLELTDPHVGPAMTREAGSSYVIGFFAATALIIVGHGAGVAANIIRHRRAKGDPVGS